jgi:hypothetical protein
MACGSIASCPVCSAKIRQGRAEEIDQALTLHLEAGGGAVLLTLTVPHDRGTRLSDLWDAVSRSWAGIITGDHRKALREQHGVIGFVRAVEVTHGAGWHPHLHVLLFTEAALDLDELRALHYFIAHRWRRRVVAMGLRAPDEHYGIRVLPVGPGQADLLGGYLTKAADGLQPASLEVARADLKQGPQRSRTPFEILEACGRGRSPRDRDLWVEWVVSSRGRHMIEFSRGLRTFLGLEERTDEEMLAEVDEAETACAIAPSVWSGMLAVGMKDAGLDAIDAAGREPGAGLAAFVVCLRQAGLDVEVRAGPSGSVVRFRSVGQWRLRR